MGSYSSLPNKLVSAANGIDYAYRDTGEGAVPLVLFQHFRGNLDNWDPALIDDLAAERRVVTRASFGRSLQPDKWSALVRRALRERRGQAVLTGPGRRRRGGRRYSTRVTAARRCVVSSPP
jgi:hypothetical protein